MQIEEIKNNAGNQRWKSEIDSDIKNLIASMVLPNPHYRPDITAVMGHSWLQGIPK